MAQKDPLVEYRGEGHVMFEELSRVIREEVVLTLFHVEVQREEAERQLQPVSAPEPTAYEHESVHGADAIAAAGGGPRPPSPRRLRRRRPAPPSRSSTSTGTSGGTTLLVRAGKKRTDRGLSAGNPSGSPTSPLLGRARVSGAWPRGRQPASGRDRMRMDPIQRSAPGLSQAPSPLGSLGRHAG